MYRGFLAGGEAICFGLDSIAIPYIKEAGGIFAFYAAGVLTFTYFATYHISETEYFTGEEGVVVPIHVVEEHELVLKKTSLPGPEQVVSIDGNKRV